MLKYRLISFPLLLLLPCCAKDADTPDTMGGFFGNTRFVFGEGEGDFVIGTADKENVGGGISFASEYDPLPF